MRSAPARVVATTTGTPRALSPEWVPSRLPLAVTMIVVGWGASHNSERHAAKDCRKGRVQVVGSPDVAAPRPDGAGAHDHHIGEAAQQGHHEAVRVGEAADLASAGTRLARTQAHGAVQRRDEVGENRRAVLAEFDRQVSRVPPAQLGRQGSAAHIDGVDVIFGRVPERLERQTLTSAGHLLTSDQRSISIRPIVDLVGSPDATAVCAPPGRA